VEAAVLVCLPLLPLLPPLQVQVGWVRVDADVDRMEKARGQTPKEMNKKSRYVCV